MYIIEGPCSRNLESKTHLNVPCVSTFKIEPKLEDWLLKVGGVLSWAETAKIW